MFTEIKDSLKDTYLCNTFDLSKVDDWIKIKDNKTTFIKKDNAGIELLRYPGFIFTNTRAASYYYNNFYKLVENVFTPPRGNLTCSSKYALVGIKPGSYYASLSQYEDCWLLGPSSEMLNRLLCECNIYPYFTNVYRSYKDESNKNIDLIIQEIKTIRAISPDITLVFMGSYEEYDMIIDKLNEKNFIKIWHPAYLLRSYSNQKFNSWKQQLIGEN
jgi:glycosyltransferase involved in cell wall biosynthesis